ncbi:SagB family peptide dehydrogenase [Paenibacillus tarimensis]
MNLHTFLEHLHFNPDKVKPPDWQADWEDAPLPYKLYRYLPIIPLSAEVPLALEGRGGAARSDYREVGHFLWYVFGLSQVSQSVFAMDDVDEGPITFQMNRRFVPSGGGLYPSELYVYLRTDDLPAGVYHYDAAHHRLVLLREGVFDSYLDRALGHRCDVSECFGVAFVSTMFWKNFFKYHNFSCRLHGLDAGVLIGQLLEVAKRFGYETAVCFQFLDRAVNHLLGLSEREESVFAVIPLSAQPAARWFSCESGDVGDGSATDLCRELAPVRHEHVVRSRRTGDFPMVLRMNEASLLESAGSFRQLAREHSITYEDPAVALPRVSRLSYDLASVCRRRYSPEADFVLLRVGQSQLAALLQEAAASFAYRNDLDGDDESLGPARRVALYGCFYGVEGIPEGAYRYDSAAHALRQIRPGDHRTSLQQGMSLHNVNLFQVPFCFHVAGDRNHLLYQLGYRGYRIQQMEAGMLVQRLLLAASALGMGGRPLLGFDVNTCDDIYRLAPIGETSLIQIPAGPYRGRPRLEGSLCR